MYVYAVFFFGGGGARGAFFNKFYSNDSFQKFHGRLEELFGSVLG